MLNDKILSIGDLRNPIAGQIDLDGVVHDVLQMDFETHQKLATIGEVGNSLEVLRACVLKVVPSLNDDVVGTFTPDIAQGILTLAGGGIAAVERMFPNALRPGGQTSPA